jgi:hypothetical protein
MSLKSVFTPVTDILFAYTQIGLPSHTPTREGKGPRRVMTGFCEAKSGFRYQFSGGFGKRDKL